MLGPALSLFCLRRSAHRLSDGQWPAQPRRTQRHAAAKWHGVKRTMMAMIEIPLVEVALACGFSSQSHFTQRFRAVSGMTPRQYTRALQG